MACLPIITWASEVPNLTITENTNSKIVELYQQLQDAKTKIDKIQSERMDKLSENYQALKENEQSLENRTLTAATTAATGIGGMELARGLFEQKADKDAEQDMAAYLATFRCEYGNGKSVKGGTTEIELPGGNGAEIMKLRAEYFALAADLKERKTALGMKPGIESEEILDKSQLGLYDNESIGITDGVYASLYRAQMLGSEKDKTAIDSDKKASKNRVIGGAVAAGSGVVGGIVGNAIINKDAPKNESEAINREYDKQIADATAEQEELAKQLDEAIAQNAADVKKYNENIQRHKDQIPVIKQSSAGCQSLFTAYIETVSELSPVENETDNVPDISLPEVSDQQALLSECTKCDNKGGIFDSDTSECPCPEDKPIEKDGKCVEKPVEITNEPVAGTTPEDEKPAEEQTPGTENTPEDGTTQTEDSEGEYCPATGNRLKSINDKTKIGDECSSTNIAAGEVVWAKTKQPKTICTCLAYVCNNGYHSVSGRCDKDEVKIPNCSRQEYNNVPNIKTGNDALKFCETKGGKQCKTVNAIKDYTGVKGKVLCNAGQDEFGAAKQRAADSKLKYYNCGENDKLPKGITCRFIQDFKREKVTPMEAEGLMKEYALKKYKDDIKCDKNSHRKSNNYRQCASRKNSKYFYEFEFKDLDAGNSGFTNALCLIWGLKGGANLCKNANQSKCNEISAAVNRTFYIGGNAELKGTNCIINSHPTAESAPVALFNSKVLTKEDMRTVGNIDPLHFYDKKLQVSANSDVYKTITNYLFVEQRLPVKQFSCGAGFVDNTMYYNVSRQKYNESQEKIRKCQQDAQTYSGGGEHAAQGMGAAMAACNRLYALDSKSGDLLSCEYDGQPIDFLFKKLDAQWNRKSTAGYQGLRCLSEGASFTGKSCTLANKEQCDSFNARFKKDYPNSKGMEWDEEMGTCVLKDAKYVSNVQKVAETTGMVALTLVTAVAGGPVVWALSVVEGAALVTEAVTEEKINDWAEAFLVDATRCSNNNSICANGVMKKHIARIMEGSKQFNETQNKQIAKQTERLLGMLDEKTLSAIVDKGELSGYIGEDREPDLEKSIRAYYGTQLTSDEKRLLATKKIATVATFATLIGGGITAGLRQSFKHNLIHISKKEQVRWLDLKILTVGDVTDDVVAMSKTGQKAAAKAGAMAPAAGKIDDVASGTNKTWEEELAEIGVKEEKSANGVVRYKDTKTGKYISEDEVLKRIDNMPGKNATPKPADDAGRAPVGNPVKSKSQKIAEARQRGDLGYHGTDADIAMDDMIRSSANSSDRLGSVGYGVARDYDAAEKYAVIRLVERQNLGKSIDFYREGDVLVIESSETLNLSNKTGYVYTTAKESSVKWDTLRNGYVGAFDAAKMPHSVEVLDKKAFNLDDLVRQGKVKIIEPNAAKASSGPKVAPKPQKPQTGTPSTKPVETKPTTPKPAETKPVAAPTTPKRTPAQEEAEWRALYEKYAPENQTFDKFKESFRNNLDKVKEYAKNWDDRPMPEAAQKKAGELWTDFHKKYDADDNSFSYATYAKLKDKALANGTYKLEKGYEKIPGLESWSKEQIEDAAKVYAAELAESLSSGKGASYSTFDPEISALKREIQQNTPAHYYEVEVDDDFLDMAIKNKLTVAEIEELIKYVKYDAYDGSTVQRIFREKDKSVLDITNNAKTKYLEFLNAKSENVQKIDKAAGLSAGVDRTTQELIAKNKFVQDFVSKRVSMYEDIIRENTNIYNRAKRWNTLSIEEREKLCKEIFEIADDKLGVKHSDFAVRDLVKDFGKAETVKGLQTNGHVYISSRHFPDISFRDVMEILAHEQAHKVDRINPNRGILGSQLADLGRTEGYIQGYTGHAYEDYRKELTEQSSWMIGAEMKKAISDLGL